MHRPVRCSALLLALCSAFASTGCVERTVTITTEPDNATVYLNDQEVGQSPVTVPFTWYGTYDVICRKDGYSTMQQAVRIEAPWYELPGIDLVSECLTPVTYRDHRAHHFVLEQEKLPTKDELLGRASEFRDKALTEGN